MIYPDLKNFLKLTAQGNLVPVYREILGDMDTPVSVYYKLSKPKDFSFLLESVEGEKKVAQFSFLAVNPEQVIRSEGNRLEVVRMKNGRLSREFKTFNESPLQYVRRLVNAYSFVNIPGLPRFCGGLVGYIGYDMVRFFERLPDKPPDDLKLPDMLLMMAKNLVIFDHLNHKIKIVSCVPVDPAASRAQKTAAYTKALDEISLIARQLEKPSRPEKKPLAKQRRPLKVRSNMTQAQYERIVAQAQKQIQAGEIIQVVLSQRFDVDMPLEPFYLYRMLRALNPSPYMYFLNFKDLAVVGSSPELLVRSEGGLVETRPIAGTRPRGKDDQEDRQLQEELLADPKEKAEHIMLVDLGRNDLGRVCRQGSVCVSEFLSVEKYSHVMHIVSNVQGRLKAGLDAFDVLQAAFPAGTVSGAPKIRAMEIIDELENVARGPYAGCIAYFSFSGNLDSCITIRTIVVTEGKAYVQAGAGIVADSVPAMEYKETVNKAKAQIQAIEAAGQFWDR